MVRRGTIALSLLVVCLLAALGLASRVTGPLRCRTADGQMRVSVDDWRISVMRLTKPRESSPPTTSIGVPCVLSFERFAAWPGGLLGPVFGCTLQCHLFLAIAVLPAYPGIALATARRRQEHRRRLGGLCVKCGYDLTGNVSGVCSECGAAVDGVNKPDGEPPDVLPAAGPEGGASGGRNRHGTKRPTERLGAESPLVATRRIGASAVIVAAIAAAAGTGGCARGTAVEHLLHHQGPGQDSHDPRSPAASDLVGEYHSSHGYTSFGLQLRKDGSFAYERRGCRGVYGRISGSYSIDRGVVVLSCSELPVRGLGAERLVPVRWDDRIYLISEGEVGLFRDDILSGLQPGYFGGMFLMRAGDVLKVVTGLPTAPAPWGSEFDGLATRRVEGRVLAVEPELRERDVGWATIDVGRDHGLLSSLRVCDKISVAT